MSAATEIAANLRALQPGDSIGTFNILVGQALAELLDPTPWHTSRSRETVLLGEPLSVWEAFDLNPEERALVRAAFSSRGIGEANVAALVDIYYRCRDSDISGNPQ